MADEKKNVSKQEKEQAATTFSDAEQDLVNQILEAANKKAAEIIETAKEEAKEIQAEPKLNSSPIRGTKKEPMVSVKFPLDNEHKADVPVSLNGKTWLIQRGKWIEVPLAVKEIIDNSKRQDEYAIAYASGLAGEFEEKAVQA